MKSTREKLGLSQAEMAGLLDIKKSFLSMCELGLRNLPGKALERLNEIELLLQQGVQKSPVNALDHQEQKNKAVFIKELQQQVNVAEMTCLKLQNTLEHLKDKFARNENLGLIIQHIKTQTNSKVPQMAYLDLLEISYLKKMAAYGLGKQIQLEYRIALLKKQNEIALKLMENLA